MIALLTAVAQLIFLVLNTKFEKDKEEKARRDEILTDWDKAIKTGDVAAINSFIDKLHR